MLFRKESSLWLRIGNTVGRFPVESSKIPERKLSSG